MKLVRKHAIGHIDPMNKTSFYGLSYNDLELLLKEHQLNPYGARVLFNWVYKKRRAGLPPNLAQVTKKFLNENISFELPHVLKDQKVIQNHQNSTQKFLISFGDSRTVECVLIPFQGKYTLCLSSQVGCAMKCSFCYTGTQGLSRNLSSEEIVGQLLSTYHWLEDQGHNLRISNLVFMGQGEPLHNFEAVQKACSIFLSQYGLSIGKEKISISTAGYLPGLKKWLASSLDVNLALSLHSTNRSIRDELIPLNKAYPLEDILELLKKWPLGPKRFITFEYLLIKDLNDREEDAHLLAELLSNYSALINLIPFNPFPGSTYERPEEEKIESFQRVLSEYSTPAMLRKTKGEDILAACGQLSSLA